MSLSENKTISIYAKYNKYGYRYNVNHPEIRKLYERYKSKIGAPIFGPPSDAQRFEFERYIDALISRQKEGHAKDKH